MNVRISEILYSGIIAVGVFFGVATIAAEHAGEHPGGQADDSRSSEHAGYHADDRGNEHAGQQAGHDERKGTDVSESRSKEQYGAEEIQSAITDYINKDQKLKNGYFYIRDEKIEHDWKLTFSKLHPVRIIERGGEKIYFACSNFEVEGTDEHDIVDVDFWMKPNESGDLEPYKIRIHKVDGEERFVYKNDKPVKK